MLKPCQWFLPADGGVGHLFPIIQSPSQARIKIVAIPGIFLFIHSFQKRASFFLPFCITCKVDTYFQKTKMMLYEKM
jgi:hypothetical protein